jgi:hypothetical protein
MNQQPSCLYKVKAMYLGNEPMGELLEGENGSDVIQAPLKRTILRTNGVGKECELSITNDSLLVTLLNNNNSFQQTSETKNTNDICLPIDMLAYCGALRQLPYDKIKQREFETLDKTPMSDSSIDPPLFVTIFRSIEKENTLYCHSFVIHRDEEAMELVKLVMEIYYNLIRLQEMEDNNNEMNDVLNGTVDSNKTNLNQSNFSKLDYKRSFNKETKELLTALSNKNKDSNKSRLNDTINSLEKTSLNESNLVESNVNNQYLNELLRQYNKTPSVIENQNEINKNNNNIINNYNKDGQYLNDILPYIDFSNKDLAKAKESDSTSQNINNYESIEKEVEIEVKEINKNNENNKLNSVSASDILKQTIDLDKYKLINVDDIKNGTLDLTRFGVLNDDKDPIIIKKENNEQIMYKQNVFIRWLQPPTPPPPAPIIIREVQEPAKEPAPLVIYKQAPRPITPPPLVIRERPPTPIETPMEPLIIEKRISVPDKPRKIIIEHLPAPPPKPRDIILEKWLPKDPPPRSVIYQKSNYPTRPVYEVIDNNNVKQSPNMRQKRNIYEVFDQKQPKISSKQQSSRRSNSNDQLIYNMQPSNIYSSNSFKSTAQPVHQAPILFSSKGANEANHRRNFFNINELYQLNNNNNNNNNNINNNTNNNNNNYNSNNNKSRLAGYRIIRQIIPGPNSSEADIERAIARSQYVNTSSYAPVQQPTPQIHHVQRRVYSPYSDFNSISAPYRPASNSAYYYKSLPHPPVGLYQTGQCPAYRQTAALPAINHGYYPIFNERYNNINHPRKISEIFRSCSFENY